MKPDAARDRSWIDRAILAIAVAEILALVVLGLIFGDGHA